MAKAVLAVIGSQSSIDEMDLWALSADNLWLLTAFTERRQRGQYSNVALAMVEHKLRSALS